MRPYILLLAVLAAGCSRPPDGKVQALPTVDVVRPIALGSLERDLTAATYPVRLTYDREADISLRVAGVLSAAPPRPGQLVLAGSLVAAVNPTSYVQAERRAQAEVTRLEREAERSRILLPQGAVSEAEVQATESALGAARAMLRAAQYDRESATARAPFAGVILERYHEIGETVSPGEPIVRVADTTSPLLARAAVTPDLARKMTTRAAAEVSLATGVTLTGRVYRVGANVDPATGTVEVDLELPRGADLPSGLTGSVALVDPVQRQGATALAIPAEALLEADGPRGQIFVLDPKTSKARRTAVSLRGFVGDMLRVEGLDARAQVITAGAGFVRDGQTVQAIAR